MSCAACGADNRDGRRFCSQCGEPLAVACSACGAANEPADRFCGDCGAALAAPAAATPTNERRVVSVLFADLVGFTTLSEHRDPEEVRELLSRYFERCRTLIERYGGVVEKFIGDAVMAVWGTPVAREDDAERAVRAALALTQAVTDLGAAVGMADLRVRAGVLTGPAAVRVGGGTEAMVLGDTVNTAARLQALAMPGGVLVDDVTRRASEAAILYEDGGRHAVKGRDQPVHAWTAVCVVAGVGGARRGPGVEAPFVGREAELAALVGAWERSVADGAARRVMVVGDAGTGKSRLLWEVFKHVDGVADEEVWWHQGRCLSYGEGVGFWALAEMVRARAGIEEDESPATAREKLGEAVRRFVTDERERRLVEPRLAHLLGLEDRVAADRADLYSGWRLFFERMAATGPVALVFEDLQWADSGLLDFVDYVLEWSAQFPIFVLALGRPDLVDRRPAWPRDVELRPLGDEAIRRLLDGYVPGLPDELARRIVDRAEGVPLYAVETVRMLLDRGLLAQQGARYAVTGDVTDLDVPETLHALAAARLDCLDVVERAVLQDAAVVGQSVTAAAVAAVGGRSRAEVEQALERLIAKQVLRREDGQYRFLQGLLRTVAYGTLSRRDRKSRHLAAARHLQELSADGSVELAEPLAAHFLAAAEAEPEAADASRIRASACATLAEAGRRALSLALGLEAQRAFDRAAELAEDEAERADLLEQAGRAACRAGELHAARERLDASIALHEAAGRRAAAARARAVVADVLWTVNELAPAIELAEQALADLPDDGPDRAAVAALLGKLRLFSEDVESGLEATDRALCVAEPLQLWDTVSDAFITRGCLLGHHDRPEEAWALLRHGTLLAEQHDLPAIALRGFNNLGWFAAVMDRLELAREPLVRALAIARARGDRVWERAVAYAQASLEVQVGAWDEAEALTTTADGAELVDWDALQSRATVVTARGRLEEAAAIEAVAREGLGSPDRQTHAIAAVTCATIAQARGDHEAATALLRPLLGTALLGTAPMVVARAGRERDGTRRVGRARGPRADGARLSRRPGAAVRARAGGPFRRPAGRAGGEPAGGRAAADGRRRHAGRPPAAGRARPRAARAWRAAGHGRARRRRPAAAARGADDVRARRRRRAGRAGAQAAGRRVTSAQRTPSSPAALAIAGSAPFPAIAE